MPEDKAPTPAANAPSAAVQMAGKAGTVLVGFALLMIGLVMVIPDGDTGRSGMEHALGALVTALGAAVIATVLLPNSLEVNGEKVKIFGLNLKASGGAAVFVLALMFAYFGAQIFGDKPAGDAPAEPIVADGGDEDGEAEQSDAGEDGESAAVDGPDAVTGEAGGTLAQAEFDDLDEEALLEALEEEAGAMQAGAVQVAGPTYLAWPYDTQYQFNGGLVGFRTYSNAHCPGGPSSCPIAGAAAEYNPLAAQQAAVTMCVAMGGNEIVCTNNLEQF